MYIQIWMVSTDDNNNDTLTLWVDPVLITWHVVAASRATLRVSLFSLDPCTGTWMNDTIDRSRVVLKRNAPHASFDLVKAIYACSILSVFCEIRALWLSWHFSYSLSLVNLIVSTWSIYPYSYCTTTLHKVYSNLCTASRTTPYRNEHHDSEYTTLQ